MSEFPRDWKAAHALVDQELILNHCCGKLANLRPKQWERVRRLGAFPIHVWERVLNCAFDGRTVWGKYVCIQEHDDQKISFDSFNAWFGVERPRDAAVEDYIKNDFQVTYHCQFAAGCWSYPLGHGPSYKPKSIDELTEDVVKFLTFSAYPQVDF